MESSDPASPPQDESIPPPPAPAEAAAVPQPSAEPPLLGDAAVFAKLPPPARFVFHGDAHEFFRIWIVNTLLSILTLGVFSAWGKVRKRRYLRGNTELLGHRFDYTADPRRLLIGNLIVVTIFLAYGLFGSVYPVIRLLALGVGLLLLPWVIVRSLSFNAHHTVWRGLRFRFHPSLSAAVMVYLLKPMLIPLTLGFYYPAWVRAKTEFRLGRHRFGTAYFHFEAGNAPFYRAYLAAGGLMFIGALLMGLLTAWLTARNAGHVPTTTQLIPGLLIYGAMFFLAKHYAFARLFNPTWNATRLDGHRFRANLRTGRWVGLQITNLAAIIFSCGLLYPWALVRSARYALDSLELHPDGPFELINRMGNRTGSAVGDTAAEFVGVDFGL